MKIRTKIFHIAMLEPAPKNAKLAESIELEEDPEEYEVETILDSRLEKGQVKYFIKWKDYDWRYNSWVRQTPFLAIPCVVIFPTLYLAANTITDGKE